MLVQRAFRLLPAFVLLAGSLTACSSVTDGTGTIQGQKSGTSTSGSSGQSGGNGLSIRWHAKIGGGIGDEQLAGGSADAKHVYISSDSGKVFALDPSTGHVLWRAQPGTRSGTGIGNAAGVAFYYDSNIGVVALDGNTGRVLWKGGQNGGYSGGDTFDPAYAQGVVALTGNTGVVGVDVHTGRRRWAIQSTNYVYGLTQPAATAGAMFGLRQSIDGNGSPSIVGISPVNGRLTWSAPLPGVGRETQNNLVPAGNDILVASQDDSQAPTTLIDFDARTHVHRWTASVPDINPDIDTPGVDGRTLIWPTLKGMRGVSLDTGKVLFTDPLGGGGPADHLGTCAGHICALGLDTVTEVDATGKVIGEVKPPDTPNDEPAKPILNSTGHTYLYNATYVYGLG